MLKAFKKFGEKIEKAANTVGSGLKEGVKNMSPEKMKERQRKYEAKKRGDSVSESDHKKDKHKHKERRKSKSSHKRDNSSSPPVSRSSTPPPSQSNRDHQSEEAVTPKAETAQSETPPAAAQTPQTEVAPTPERVSVASVSPTPAEDPVLLSISEDEEVPVPEFHEVEEEHVEEAPVRRATTVEEVIPVDVPAEPEPKPPAKAAAKPPSVLSKSSSIDFATETGPSTALLPSAKDPSIKFQIEDDPNDAVDDEDTIVVKEEAEPEKEEEQDAVVEVPAEKKKPKSSTKTKKRDDDNDDDDDDEDRQAKNRKKAHEKDRSVSKKESKPRKKDADKDKESTIARAESNRQRKKSSKREAEVRDAGGSRPSSRASSAHERSAPSSRASTPMRDKRAKKSDTDDEVSLDKRKRKKDTYGRPTMDKRTSSLDDEEQEPKSKRDAERRERHRDKRPSPRHSSTRRRGRNDSPNGRNDFDGVNYRDLLDQCRADAKYLNERALQRRASPSYPRGDVEYRPTRRELEEEEEEARYEARQRSRQQQQHRSPARAHVTSAKCSDSFYEDERPFRHSPYRDRGSELWRAQDRGGGQPRDYAFERSYSPDQREHYQGRRRRTSSAADRIHPHNGGGSLNGSFARGRDGVTPRERARQYEEERMERLAGGSHSRRSSRHASPRAYVEEQLASSRHSSVHPSPRRTASATRPRPERLDVSALSGKRSPLRERARYAYSPPVEYRMMVMRREEEEEERERSRSESSMVSEKDLLDEVEWKLDSLAQEIVVEDAILEDRMRSSPFERLYHMNNRRDRDERRKKLVQYNKLEKIRQKITTGSLDEEIRAREEKRQRQEALLTDPSGVYLRLYNNYASAKPMTPIKKAENDTSLATASQNGKSRGASTVLDHSKKDSGSRGGGGGGGESPRPPTPQRSRSYIKNMSERLYKDAANEREKHQERTEVAHEERLKKEMEEFLVGRLMARMRATRTANSKWQTDAQLEAEARRQIQERLQQDEGALKKDLIDGKRLNSYDQKVMTKRLAMRPKVGTDTIAQKWQEEQMKNCTFKPEINKYSEKLAGSTVQKYGEMKKHDDDVSSVSVSDEDEDHSEEEDGSEGGAHRKSKGKDRCQILYEKAVTQQHSAERLAEEKRDEERHRILRSKLENDHHFRRRVELDPTLADRFMKSLAV